MKRRTNPTRNLRPARPAPRPDFDSLLVAYVEAHCPQEFVQEERGRAISAQGVLSYLEAIAAGEEPGDRQTARAGALAVKESIRQRASNSNQPNQPNQ